MKEDRDPGSYLNKFSGVGQDIHDCIAEFVFGAKRKPEDRCKKMMTKAVEKGVVEEIDKIDISKLIDIITCWKCGEIYSETWTEFGQNLTKDGVSQSPRGRAYDKDALFSCTPDYFAWCRTCNVVVIADWKTGSHRVQDAANNDQLNVTAPMVWQRVSDTFGWQPTTQRRVIFYTSTNEVDSCFVFYKTPQSDLAFLKTIRADLESKAGVKVAGPWCLRCPLKKSCKEFQSQFLNSSQEILSRLSNT